MIPYTDVYHKVARILGIRPNSYTILAAIYYSQNKYEYRIGQDREGGGACKHNEKDLAELLGLSEFVVSKAVGKLKEAGLIEMVDGHMRASEKFYSQLTKDNIESKGDGWYFTKVLTSHRVALGISPNDYCLLNLMAWSQAHPDYSIAGWCKSGYGLIAKTMGLPRPTVVDMVARLEEKGFVEVKFGNRRVSELFFDWTGRDEQQAEEEDAAVNSEIEAEVRRRLDKEVGANGMRLLFGDGIDLQEAEQYVVDSWMTDGRTTVIPADTKKSSLARDFKYKSCLRGFMAWLESLAGNSPSKTLVTSRRKHEMEYELLKQTAIAIGKAGNHEWHIHWRPKWHREVPFELDEDKLRQFARSPGTIDEKRKYLAYRMDGLPCTEPFLPKLLGETLKEIERNNFYMDAEVLAKAKEHFEKWEWLGRPRSVEIWRPQYTGYKPWPDPWKNHKDFFTEFDNLNPPIFLYDRNGDKIK